MSVAAGDGTVEIVGGLASGVSGQRIEINPGGTGLPEIRFFPTNGSNYAFINAVGGGSGGAYIGLNSGTFRLRDQDSAFRLYLTDYVSTLETIRTDTQEPWGGAVRMAAEGASLVYLSQSQLHGYVYASEQGASLGRRNDDGSTSEIWIAGSAVQYRGTWTNYWYAEPDYGLFTGTVQMNDWNGMSLGYGPTMASDMVPIATIRDSQAWHRWMISVSNRTGFTMALDSNSPDGSVGFWCFRI